MEKVHHESPYIVDGHEKLYGEESILSIITALVDEKAAVPMFQEFIYEKNGINPEVECLRVEHFFEATSNLESKPMLSLMIEDYTDREMAKFDQGYSKIERMRTDLIELLNLDCNTRSLKTEPNLLIDGWIRKSPYLQEIISEIESLILEPGFKEFNSKILSKYILGDLVNDLTQDYENKQNLLTSFRYMTGLEVTNSYFMAAMNQLYSESPYFVNGHEKLYGEETIFNLMRGMVVLEAAGPVFQEFIHEKNEIVPNVECIQSEIFVKQVTKLKKKPLPFQLVFEYFDDETSKTTPEHADIIQLR